MRRSTSAPSRFYQESRSKSERPARAAGSPPQPSCPQRSSRQAVLVVPNDFIVGQMFVESRQGVEVCEDLRELGAVDTTLPTCRHSLGQSFIHCAIDSLGQGLASALGELADFGFGGRIFDDHAHLMIHEALDRTYIRHLGRYILLSRIWARLSSNSKSIPLCDFRPRFVFRVGEAALI